LPDRYCRATVRDIRVAHNLEGPRIYIIDDDDAVRDSLRSYLTLKGFAVNDFSSAQQFLDCDLVEPSVLILDVNMPNLDGFSLLEILRREGRELPVVLMSGLADRYMRDRGRRAGAAAFLGKPIDAPVLYTTVTSLLSKLQA
jgi:two-component system response regulator FixJ